MHKNKRRECKLIIHLDDKGYLLYLDGVKSKFCCTLLSELNSNNNSNVEVVDIKEKEKVIARGLFVKIDAPKSRNFAYGQTKDQIYLTSVILKQMHFCFNCGSKINIIERPFVKKN